MSRKEKAIIRHLIKKGYVPTPEMVEKIIAVRRKALKLPPVSRGRNTLSGGVVIEEF